MDEAMDSNAIGFKLRPDDHTTSSIDDADACAYLCESLIEYNDQYHIVISRLTVDENLIVTGFEPCSQMKISSMEAAMMLAKPEFITVYETLIPVDEFSSLLAQVPLSCLITRLLPRNSFLNPGI